MQSSSLLVVVVELSAVMFNDLNLVTTVALVSTGMKESSVLITLNCSSDFTSLLP